MTTLGVTVKLPDQRAADPVGLFSRARQHRGFPVLMAVALGVVYAAVAETVYLVFSVAGSTTGSATFWPGAGLAFVAFVASPRRHWPYLAVAVVAAEMLVDHVNGVVWTLGLSWGLANTIEPIVGALVVQRFIPPSARRDTGSHRNLFVFIGGAVIVGPAIGALIGVGGAALTGRDAGLVYWLQWLVGDGIGVLVVAPPLLLFFDRRAAGSRWRPDLLLLTAVVVAVSLGPVHFAAQSSLAYLILPALVWLAFAADPRSLTLAVLVVALVTNAATIIGFGPFLGEHGVFNDLASAQVFVGSVAFTALFVAVLAANLVRRDLVEAMLRHQSGHDALTSLPNRRAIFDRLERVDGAGADGGPEFSAFLMIDLDGFKEVNDSLGHRVGDLVLVEASHRLAGAIRSADMVGRLGGDEFLVCLGRPTPLGEVEALATRLAAVLSAPIVIDGREITIGASIGIGLTEGTSAADEALARADADMYRNKRLKKVS